MAPISIQNLVIINPLVEDETCLNCDSYGYPCINCQDRDCEICNETLYTCALHLLPRPDGQPNPMYPVYMNPIIQYGAIVPCINCDSYGYPCINCQDRDCEMCNETLYTCVLHLQPRPDGQPNPLHDPDPEYEGENN